MEAEMSDTKENMVLRTVYLPNAVDRALRQLAFSRNVSKADLIRDFIKSGLGEVEASGEKTLAARVQERIAHQQAVASSAVADEQKKSAKKAVARKSANTRGRVNTAAASR
jgi:predicted DNA-binding protein